MPAIGGNKIKNGLFFAKSKKLMLVIKVQRMPSLMLKLKAIPVYLTCTGNISAKIEGSIAAWMVNKNTKTTLSNSEVTKALPIEKYKEMVKEK